jgi:membrane protein DedA with SNARE-associated domain
MQLPLELFVFLGAFVEEIISPIPSFVVMIPAGAAAQIQGFGWWYLLPLGLLGGFGRLFASLILYVVADKAEDWLFGKGRRFFGVTHKQLEDYGQRLEGRRGGFVALLMLNALPVLPTSLLSLSCGFIKVPLRMFVAATFFGSAINAVFYMSLGYAGFRAMSELKGWDVVLQILAVLAVVSVVIWFVYYNTKKRSR